MEGNDKKQSSMKSKTKTVEKINETNSWFLKKINEIEEPLAKLTKEKN